MYLGREELETQITKTKPKSLTLRGIYKHNKPQCSALGWLQDVLPPTLYKMAYWGCHKQRGIGKKLDRAKGWQDSRLCDLVQGP